jgi:hypothetical protein
VENMTVEYPVVLVDQPEDVMIEETGWIEANEATPDIQTVVQKMEQDFPLEDRAEEEHYVCEGQQEWMAPVHNEPCDECGGEGPDDCPGCEGTGTVPHEAIRWETVDPQTLDPRRRGDARLFWVVKVVCKV